MAEFRLESERLVLRSWRADQDGHPFHVVCSDPKLTAKAGPVMIRDEVAALMARMQGTEAERGHCFGAMCAARLIG
ncbi:MAG: hypothetical protein ACK4YM_08220 [Novosphingobium sp.]